MADGHDMFAGIPPEMLKQILGLSTYGEEGNALEQQLAQAEALRNGNSQPHSTGMGAALGAISDIGNGAIGGLRENALRKQQAELWARKRAGLQGLGGMLSNDPLQGAGAGDTGGGSPFGYG